MILYEPFWKTLEEKGMTTYDLIYKQGISANTIHRMKHGKAITTTTLDELCFVLNCDIADVIERVEDHSVEK